MKESESDFGQSQILQGRWLSEEHQRFLRGIMQYGKDWKNIENVVKSRTGSQIRSHSQKFFIKVNKIIKERRKIKNQDKIEFSEIQDEILELFSETDLTENTPKELISIIKRDFSGGGTQRKLTKKNKKQENENNQEQKVQRKINENEDDPEKEQNQEESYFVKIFKYNHELFIKGNDFSGLIDFGSQREQGHEERQKRRQRSKSFALLEEEEDSQELKKRLQNLHKVFHPHC